MMEDPIKIEQDSNDNKEEKWVNTTTDDPVVHSTETNENITIDLTKSSDPEEALAVASKIPPRDRKNVSHFEFIKCRAARNRQKKRLIMKLKKTIDEYNIRLGLQGVAVLAKPDNDNPNDNSNFMIYGSQPLKNVVKKMHSTIEQDMEQSIIEYNSMEIIERDKTLFELPPLIIDGIPMSLNKMNQAQLRTFIPLMLKYSTGRGKPKWGKESMKPQWWPQDVPWANVRTDSRTADEKKTLPWTMALRKIVYCCYEYHKRLDLLPQDKNEPPSAVEEKSDHPANDEHQVELIEIHTDDSSEAFNTIKTSEGYIYLYVL